MLSQLATEDDPRCLAGLMGATAEPAAEVRAAAVRAVQAVARPGKRAANQVRWGDGEREELERQAGIGECRKPGREENGRERQRGAFEEGWGDGEVGGCR